MPDTKKDAPDPDSIDGYRPGDDGWYAYNCGSFHSLLLIVLERSPGAVKQAREYIRIYDNLREKYETELAKDRAIRAAQQDNTDRETA